MRKAQYLLKPLFFPKILITTDTGRDVRKISYYCLIIEKQGVEFLFKNLDFAENIQN
jgi:hypothetical protein